MNNNKYYKVKQIKNKSGEIEFKVFACESWFEKFTGYWKEYAKENKTLESAKDQIDYLVSDKIIKGVTVYKRKVKKND